jgi:hypothetical protein
LNLNGLLVAGGLWSRNDKSPWRGVCLVSSTY